MKNSLVPFSINLLMLICLTAFCQSISAQSVLGSIAYRVDSTVRNVETLRENTKRVGKIVRPQTATQKPQEANQAQTENRQQSAPAIEQQTPIAQSAQKNRTITQSAKLPGRPRIVNINQRESEHNRRNPNEPDLFPKTFHLSIP